ncbi:polar amino acid transport system permease protein [Methylobacterium sp. UNC378MF]|uniref:amino acid ABC transporter permease n=1 Tax=Methylobacterium sp. UNC378MF TaxID=1502748 RepID=UPI00088FCF6B|nr:amino acid ABC transporter permease [Methylobacterium sp. UNC378MF]SDA30852.1 polar amino acid transport system permease protein [Methylobacterium sp. UNC378MF]
MIDAALQRFIAGAAALGLHYDFLLSGGEVRSWLAGMAMTLLLVVLAIPLSLLAGTAFAAALTSGRPWLAGPVRAYVELTRNTPTLVQLMFAFFALNMLLSRALGGAAHNPFSPVFWVVAVTGLHVAAFHAEALRGGIEAVPAPLVEAAQATGFSGLEILRYVTLPLALRTALPALVNNLVNLVKLTTIGSAVAVNEVTYASIMIWTQRDNVLELMIVILLFFGLINLTVSRIGRAVERRLAVPGYGVGYGV